LRNASTVNSPQYPAAIAAGMRRGQEPVGIMAERTIAKSHKRELCRNRAELLARPVAMDDANHLWRVKRRKQANRRRRWRSVFKDVVGVPPPVSPTSGYWTLEGHNRSGQDT
jgi:hypothetical protein